MFLQRVLRTFKIRAKESGCRDQWETGGNHRHGLGPASQGAWRDATNPRRWPSEETDACRDSAWWRENR